jgi:pyruvate formate lyase activating enzyme
MDIKNSRARYGETVGIENFDIKPVEESVELLRSSGVDYEFRTTLTKDFHTPQDMHALAEWIKGTPKYFLQNFVDSGNLIDASCKGLSKAEMNEMLEIARLYVPSAELRGI